MVYQKHSVEFDDQPPLKFLVERHWWILTALYIDEQGRVCELEGKYSEGHPERRTFDLSQVRNPIEIFFKICEIEEERQGNVDDYHPYYVSAFADGHKPNCPMATPISRNAFKEHFKRMFKGVKMKLSDVGAIIEAEMARLCTCDNASKD